MNRQRGATLIEALAAVTVGVALLAGLIGFTDSALSETKSQQAALYQAQVTAAAAKYIKANYDMLLAQATTTTPAPPISVAMLKPQYLPANFRTTNPYGQSPCLLVLKNATGQLNALLVNEGGSAIPAKEVAYAASRSGQGGGYIPAVTGGTPPPLEVKGAYGGWAMNNASLSPYLTAKCSANLAGAGSLASLLYYDSAGQSSTDFLYRNAVPGRPELNRMNRPLRIRNQALVAVENSSDQYCTSADTGTYGGISTNAAGEVMSCQAGVWRRQNKFWREPVAAFASLPATGNNTGDVRMVTGAVNRAFTWDGSAWKPLDIDQNGDMVVPNVVKINGTATYGAACQKGQIGKDANGKLLSCESTTWKYASHPELLYQDDMPQLVVLRSNFISYPAGTVFYTDPVYLDAGGMHYSYTERYVSLPKDGTLIVNYSGAMYRRRSTSTYDFSRLGQYCVYVEVYDYDTSTSPVWDGHCTPVLNNDWASPTINITRKMPKNTNGYGVGLYSFWSLIGTGTSDDIYTRSNYSRSGFIYEDTPISSRWNIQVVS